MVQKGFQQWPGREENERKKPGPDTAGPAAGKEDQRVTGRSSGQVQEHETFCGRRDKQGALLTGPLHSRIRCQD